ncbi:MAG: hypothetical protein ACOX6T_00440 [Myxococcales bacterium]|jgi:hypothetical protein
MGDLGSSDALDVAALRRAEQAQGAASTALRRWRGNVAPAPDRATGLVALSGSMGARQPGIQATGRRRRGAIFEASPAEPTMSDAELPPASLILQALHAIRKEIAGTNTRLDVTREELSARIDQTNTRLEETNRRLDETNEKLDQLRVFTVQKLTDLNAKVDRLGERADVLGDRLENILTG